MTDVKGFRGIYSTDAQTVLNFIDKMKAIKTQIDDARQKVAESRDFLYEAIKALDGTPIVHTIHAGMEIAFCINENGDFHTKKTPDIMILKTN